MLGALATNSLVMPAPGVGDDGVKVGVLRRPSQLFAGFFRVGYQR
jgi:hypothetical protein